MKKFASLLVLAIGAVGTAHTADAFSNIGSSFGGGYIVGGGRSNRSATGSRQV